MRRIWILVPFWAFFLAYLVYYALERRPGARGESVAADEWVSGVPTGSGPTLPEPRLIEGTATGPLVARSPRRLREAMPAGLAEGELDVRLASTFEGVFVLPRDGRASPVTFLWPVDAEGSPDRRELLAVAERATFPRWKLHEDEWVRFHYPDDPAIRLEIVEGSAPFPMLGETMWTVADAPERRYRLATVGGATFCMISLEKTGAFDDTVRFPKPEIFHRQWVGDGSLHRGSLMADGNLRRVEVLAGGYRASVLDWPHCAIHREVYDRLALSVRLGGPVADGASRLAARLDEADLAGRLGFLDPGMDAASIVSLLGEPAGREGGVLLFEDRGGALGGGDFVYRVSLSGGRFRGFATGWKSLRLGPPEAGSLAWMLEKTSVTGGAEGGVGYDLGPLTDEETATMFDRFCAEAPVADAAGWEQWCRLVANLAEMGARDERVAMHIGARFLDPSLPQANATLVLHAIDPDGGRDLFAARLRALLERDAAIPAVSGVAHDMQVLFAYLGREDVRTSPLLERALGHADGEIREVGHGYRQWLPEACAAAFLERGLADSRPGIRRRCAEALCAEVGPTLDRLALVERRLAEEDDAETRAYLEEARRLLRADGSGAARAPEPERDDVSS